MAKPPVETKNKDILEAYQIAADANPNSVEAQTNLGWGLYGQGRYEQAIGQFEKALGLNGDFFDAHYGLALTCKKAGRREPAIAAFKKARDLVAGIEDMNRAQMMSKIIQTHLDGLHSHN